MDPALSMIMSNMAHVKEGDLVFDPFVGTGMSFNINECYLLKTYTICIKRNFMFHLFSLFLFFIFFECLMHLKTQIYVGS